MNMLQIIIVFGALLVAISGFLFFDGYFRVLFVLVGLGLMSLGLANLGTGGLFGNIGRRPQGLMRTIWEEAVSGET